MPTANLCQELLKQYQCQTKSQLSQASSQQQQQQQSQRGKSQKSSINNSNSNDNSDNCGSESEHHHTSLDDEYLVAKKRRVVKFIRCWMLITREHFFQQQQIQSFLTVSISSKVDSILLFSRIDKYYSLPLGALELASCSQIRYLSA